MINQSSLADRYRAFTEKYLHREGPWIALMMVFIFFVRWSEFGHIIYSWDETCFFVIAQDILRGGVPYITAWDQKGPLLFFLFTPVIGLFGASLVAIRVFTAFYILVAMFYAHKLSTKLIAGKVRVLVPLLYGWFFTISPYYGTESNGEIFMMLPAVMALYYFLEALDGGPKAASRFFWSGFLCALAILVKPTVLFTVVIIPLTALVRLPGSARYPWKAFFKDAALWLMGGLAATSIFVAYFLSHHALYDFYYAVFGFNVKYIDRIPLQEAFRRMGHRLFDSGEDIVGFSAWVSLAFIWVLRAQSGEKEKKAAVFISALTFLSLMGVFVCRNNYSHYFLQMSLPFCLLTPFALSLIPARGTFPAGRAFPAAVVLVAVVAFAAVHQYSEVGKNRREFSYNRQTNPEFQMADFVKKNTAKDDYIYVLGGQPLVYFLTERRAPTKYFYWVHLNTEWDRAGNLTDGLLADFAAHPPKYILFSDKFPFDWLRRPPRIKKYMMENYVFDARVSYYSVYRLKGLPPTHPAVRPAPGPRPQPPPPAATPPPAK